MRPHPFRCIQFIIARADIVLIIKLNETTEPIVLLVEFILLHPFPLNFLFS